MVRQTTKIIILEALALLLILVLLGAGLLTWRLASGPVDLSLFRGDVEAALTRLRDGRAVQMASLSLEWEGRAQRLVISAGDIAFLDEAGTPAARAERAIIAVDAGALLARRIKPLRIDLEKGWLIVQQRASGWQVAGEPLGQISTGAVSSGNTPLNFARLADLADVALSDMLNALRARGDDISLSDARIHMFDVIAHDSNGAEIGRLSAAEGGLRRDRRGAHITLAGQSDGRAGLPAGVAVDLFSPPDFSSLRAEFGFAGWSLEALATRFGQSTGNSAGLSTDLAVAISTSSQSGLVDITADATINAGALEIGTRPISVDEVVLSAQYNRPSDTLRVQAQTLETSLLRGAVEMTLPRILGSAPGPRPMQFKSEALRIDLRPMFSDPWNIQRIRGVGYIDPIKQSLELDTFTFRHGALRGTVRGEVARAEGIAPQDIPVRLRLDAELSGDQSVRDILKFWPVAAGPRTRRYLLTNVLTGTLSEAIARIELHPKSNVGGHLADDAIRLRFGGRDVSVQYLRDMPPITGANVTGTLTGNSFRLDFTDGEIGNWVAETGFVHYPKLNPQGENMIVEVRGRGETADLLSIISESRLQLEARSGFNPRRITGQGELTYRLVRPARPNVTFAETQMTAEGRVSSARFESLLAGQHLENGTAQVRLAGNTLTVSGYGDLGHSPVTFTWQDTFDDQNTPAALQATAGVNRDVLNTFGVLGRAYLSGEVPLDIRAELQGVTITEADIALDFSSARLTIDELGWSKPLEEPATGRLRYQSGAGRPRAAIDFEAADMRFSGDLAFAANGGLLSANLDEAWLQDRVDVAASVRRESDGDLSIELRGPLLDVSGLLGGLGTGISNDNSAIEAQLAAGLAIDAEVDRLILRPGFDMQEATLSLNASKDGLQDLRAGGVTAGGDVFGANYRIRADGAPEVNLRSQNAGFIANALFGLDLVEGGSLALNGTLGTDSNPARFDVEMSDIRLKDAPFFTQFLSLASLRGVNDTLGGDGILFTEVEAPLTIQDGRYFIEGARASGPALGVTTRGWLDGETGELDLDGVLVPSFGMNSALGGIPIIGDLFVGRRGEGIFSLRYGIEGSLNEARVSVNPLSAITPGILRRIFDAPDRETLPEPRPVEQRDSPENDMPTDSDIPR